jgi:putative transposase
MSRKYKFGDNDKLYFISFAVVYWIDLFIRKEYKDILIDSWKYCQKEKDLEIYGWCIMSSHVHMIVGTKERPLDKIVGEMKSFTSRSLRKAIEEHTGESRKEWILWMMKRAGLKNGNNKDWQLWQQHNQPIELLTIEMFYQKLQYTHYNPVEAGFVEHEEDYWYSSARDFHGKKGLIELSYVV